jgi:TRAP-type C4-dicarboxylate transport system permease large subunit
MAKRALDVFDILIGKLPGRLSLIVITGGALFSTLSGSTITRLGKNATNSPNISFP